MNELIALGCGSSDSLENYNANVLIANQNGTLLIDCGHTIKHALRDQNMEVDSIDAIFITHVHGDHVFGLERIAFETYYSSSKKISLYFHKNLYHQLWDETLKGSLGSNHMLLEDYFDIHLIENNEFDLFGNHYQIFEVKHVPNVPAYGMNINEDVFYSGDTTQIVEIIKDINFNVGLHDFTFHDSPLHVSLDSLLECYPLSIRKKLYLNAYPDGYEKYETLISENFKGLSKQGMHIEFDLP